MTFISSISIKNFRTFKDSSSLDFCNINLITGANNAGKSSITKLLLLLKDSFEKNKLLNNLDFTGKEHALGFFENAVNASDNTNPITITLPFPLLNSSDYKIELSFSKKTTPKSYEAICNKVRIFNYQLNSTLLQIERVAFVDNAENYWDSIQDSFNLILETKLLNTLAKSFNENIENNRALRKEEYKKIFNDDLTFKLPEYQDDNEPEEQTRYYDFEARKDQGYINLENNITCNYTEKEEEALLRSVIEFLRFENINEFQENYQVTGEDIAHFYNRSTEPSKNLIQSALKVLNFKKNEGKNISSAELISTRALLEHIIIDAFQKVQDALSTRLVSVPLYRGNIKRWHPADGNILDKTVNELASLYNKPDFILPKLFIDEWLNKFDIDGFNTLEVTKYFEYEISTLVLKNKVVPTVGSESLSRKPLSDLGFGSAQLFLLLAKIAVEARKYADYDEDYDEAYFSPHILLIEEPEAHLHPKWQSLLADVLIDACDRFKTQFIIETHSEYLIRRIQYNISKRVIKPENVKIYQIQKDSSYNSIAINMDLDYTGKFKHQFVNGFFDEETTLQDELSIQAQLEEYQNHIQKLVEEHQLNIKCVVLTEDSDAEDNYSSSLACVLKANGFKESEYQITSYKTSGDKRLAAGMAKILEQKSSIELVIWHVDGDGQQQKRNDEIRGIIKELNLVRTVPFVTKYNDIEGYFTNIDHLHSLFDSINHDRLDEIVLSAQKLEEEESINVLSSHFGKNRDAAELVYFSNPVIYRHSKKMIRHIKRQITQELKEKNSVSILKYSGYLKDDNLEAYSKQLQNVTSNDGAS